MKHSVQKVENHGILNMPPKLSMIVFYRIEVEPLVMTREFNMTFGEKYPLTTAVLSASQLEKLVKTEVYFYVIRKPTHGQVNKDTKLYSLYVTK